MTTSNDLPLAAKPVDRAAHRRTDAAWLEAARTSPNVLAFLMRSGDPLLEGEGPVPGFGQRAHGPSRPLFWLGPEGFRLGHQGEVFLGEDTSGTPIFALDMEDGWDLGASPIAGMATFEDMRGSASVLSALEANLASTARSLFEWHRRHGFCSNCGAASEVVEAGWKRACPACGAEHFPRTDPVAIMLAHRGDTCLVARNPGWPAGFVSALAGFVEPGETVEQAASRELEEEAGIKSDPANAEFLFCQPWPFPSSLMMGILIPADSEEISVEQDELQAAYWITREEVRAMLAGKHDRFFCPPPMAVAHHILKAWAERD
ncbi:MAG: NAD(+) diphosphatase [Pseudomonadota bacterium]